MYLKLQNDFVKKLCQRTMSSDVTVVNVISLQIVQTLCAGKVDPVDFRCVFGIVSIDLWFRWKIDDNASSRYRLYDQNKIFTNPSIPGYGQSTNSKQ